MFGYLKDNFLYVCVLKNGYTTFSTLLENNGWTFIDLQNTQIDLTGVKIWGHISRPENRHTKGVVEFLNMHPTINLDDEILAKIIVFGMYDIHTIPISILLRHLNIDINSIYWIPLDGEINDFRGQESSQLSANDLTNDFFLENGLDLQVTDNDIKNQTIENSNKSKIKEKVLELKNKLKNQTFDMPYYDLLEQDNKLYMKTIDFFAKKYNKKIR